MQRGNRRGALDGARHQVPEPQSDAVELHHAEDRPAVVDKLVEQNDLPMRVAREDVRHVLAARAVDHALLQQVGPAHDRVERRAQIVVEAAEQRDEQFVPEGATFACEPCGAGAIFRDFEDEGGHGSGMPGVRTEA